MNDQLRIKIKSTMDSASVFSETWWDNFANDDYYEPYTDMDQYYLDTIFLQYNSIITELVALLTEKGNQ